jgi:CheY-like chemotaxis protein
VKIIAISASVFKEERDNVLSVGMDDFISKPYRTNEIFDCLARNLNVRFTYKGTSDAAGPESYTTLNANALAALPLDLREALSDALIRLDPARIAVLVRRVSEVNPALGSALAHHADRFAYTTILRALQHDGGQPTKETP